MTTRIRFKRPLAGSRFEVADYGQGSRAGAAAVTSGSGAAAAALVAHLLTHY